jgi:Tol biopolymer transport system component
MHFMMQTFSMSSRRIRGREADMKRGMAVTLAIAAAVAVIAAGGQTARAQQRNPRELYERARLMEQAKDTREAVRLYTEVVAKAKDDRALTSAAEARLAALTTVKRQDGGLQSRRLLAAADENISSVSPDGVFAVGWRVGAKRIFLQYLNSDQRIELGVDGSSPIISPDGKQIAFAASGMTYLIPPIAGQKPRVLPGTTGLSPQAWMPDGKTLLAMSTTRTPATAQSVQRSWFAISLIDEKVTLLRAFEPGVFVSGPRPSPDGRWLAFVRNNLSDRSDRPLYLADARGGNEVVVSVAGMNSEPVWTADGGHVVFINTRSGSSALWSVAVQNGRPVGDPSVLQQNVGGLPNSLLGISSAGTLYNFRWIENAPHILLVDRRAGSTVRQMLLGSGPSLSPDGRTLAYLRGRPGGYDLIVRSLETGYERLLPTPNVGPLSPRWIHDGSAFIVRAGTALHVVNPSTGDSRPILPVDAADHVRHEAGELSLDDKTMYLPIAKARPGPWTGVVGVSLASGEETLRVTFPGEGFRNPPGLALSPDGRTLAVMGWGPQSPSDARLFTVGVDGAGWREIAGPFVANRVGDVFRWTADGQFILFPVANSDRVGWKMMRVSASGGQPVFDGFDTTRPSGAITIPKLAPLGPFTLRLSADDSTMYVEQRVQASNELWALENVTAVLNAKREELCARWGRRTPGLTSGPWSACRPFTVL